MSIAFDRGFSAPYGEAVRLSPLIRRVLANNPGPYTFMGTGSYIVGARDVAVIDPGPLLPSHVEALQRALAGLRVTHILVTHTHADHSSAAAALRQWSGAATYGFGEHPADDEDIEEGADRGFVPDALLKDGDVIEAAGVTLDCLHTPGHLSNHLCFALREERALFTGDHVMGWSTSVVSPPGGDMGDYIASLKKVMARRDRTLYPTHGAPIENPAPLLEAYLAHRLEREAQIAACLGDGVSSIAGIVARLYADVDVRLHPAAARNVLAHLLKLEKDGRVTEDAHRYSLRPWSAF